MLAVAMCFGFAGCGGDNNGSSGNGDGKIDAEKFVSEKVTAEEWKAALSDDCLENVKLDFYNIYMSSGEGEATTVESRSVHIFAGNKIYYNLKQSVNGQLTSQVENYYDLRNLVTYEKFDLSGENTGDEWTKSDIPSKDVEQIMSNLTEGYFFMGLADYFDKFEYSEEQKGYVNKPGLQEDDPANCGNGVFKFKDKKLVAVFMLETDGDEADYTRYEFIYTYGNQKVDLPSVNK